MVSVVPMLPRVERPASQRLLCLFTKNQKKTQHLLQDKERGGISDRPEDAVDVFHTFFGIAGIT
jgi:prenyltransferase beta subunit